MYEASMLSLFYGFSALLAVTLTATVIHFACKTVKSLANITIKK